MMRLLTILFIGSFFYGFGQQELSAKDAILRALENNFQVQIAEKQVDIAEKNNTWSEAGLFPTVELSAGMNNTVIDNTNNPFTFTPGLIYNRSLSPGITANWNIFTGLAVKITKDRLEQLEAQSNGNANLIMENTAFDVLTTYYNCLVQHERLNTFRKVFNTTKLQVEFESSKMNLGQTNKLAMAQIQNQLFSDSINILQQEVNYENALRNLMLLMNVPIEEIENSTYPVLTDSLNIVLDPIDQSEVITDLKSNNQNLKNQLINEQLQQTNTQLQRSFLYPTLNLQLGASPSFGNFRSLSDNNLQAETQQINYFANLNLRYTLFSNWKNKRAVEVAKIQEEISIMNTQELEKQLVSSAVQLTELYQVRNNLVDVASANVQYAKEAFELGEERFKLGSINSIELAQLRNTYVNAQLNYTNLLFQRIQTFLEIYRTSGNLLLSE